MANPLITNAPSAVNGWLTPVGTRADTRNFIYFSSETKGETGRKVFIDSALIPKFLSLLDPSSADGKRTLWKLSQLRSLASRYESAQNLKNSFDFMDKFGSLGVRYSVFQGKGQKGAKERAAGVYIVDIAPAFDGDANKSGLYHFQFGESSSIMPRKDESELISYEHASINGYSATTKTSSSTDFTSLESAAELVRDQIGKSDWGGSKNFSMYYMSAPLRNELGVWVTGVQKSYKVSEAAKKLGRILVNTQKYRETQGKDTLLEWSIIGDGVDLLAQAIKQIPQAFLSRHAFTFINPTGKELSSLLPKLERMGAQFGEKAVVSQTQDHRSAIMMAANSEKVASAIQKLGRDLNRQTAYNANAAQILQRSQGPAIALNNARITSSGHDSLTFVDAIKRTVSMTRW